MSGGSMDNLYFRVERAEFEETTAERKLFRQHLMLVAAALKAIEWHDSGDGGPDAEVEAIQACLNSRGTGEAELAPLPACLGEPVNTALCACGAFAMHDGRLLHAAQCTVLANQQVAVAFQQGDVVRYVPHGLSDPNHPEADAGIVSGANGDFVFVRFGIDTHLQACRPEQLQLVRRP